jgi:hypothetical protein
LEGRATTPNVVPLRQVAEDLAESSAEYIAQMTLELAQLANAAGLDMLTYLLNMARLEAENHAIRKKS